jgi:chromate transporter
MGMHLYVAIEREGAYDNLKTLGCDFMKDNRLWRLFWTFFKIGLLSFGGGYAMLPMVQTELVEKLKWFSDEEMLDILAIAQSGPGAVIINTASFVGYKMNGVFGLVSALLGIIMPSFVIIVMISSVYLAVNENVVVTHAFNGIKTGVTVMLFSTILNMASKLKFTLSMALISVCCLILVTMFHVSTVFVVIGVIALSAAVAYISLKRGEGGTQ